MSEDPKVDAAGVDDEELEPAELLEELLEEITAGLGLDAEVEVEESDGMLRGRIKGEEVGLFIGRRGQTIDAVQHLAQRIVFPEGPSAVRVEIDADGYRERRAELLREDADDAAEEALRDGRLSLSRCRRRSGGSCTSTCVNAAAWRRTARARSPSASSSSRQRATDRWRSVSRETLLGATTR
jgi:predicted RNA-binding protein YlqC (UPF0109 family)